MKETRFSILKALAIFCVVLSHAGAAGWVSNFVYLFHVPAFFLCAGYFFNTRYLTDERTFLVRRVRGLYFPFLRWSIFFLLIHNLLFPLGLLSETYGNAGGGVTHPYTWHQTAQHLWSIVFNMSGYDLFLGGAFWFFRAFFLASIGFLLLFKFVRWTGRFESSIQAGWGILGIALLLTTWKVGGGLTLTGVAQGGYRELMGITFMAAGFLLRQYHMEAWNGWKTALPSLAVLLLFTFLCPTSMEWNPDFASFIALPLPAVAGFLLLHYLSGLLDRKENIVKRALVYVGDRTLYIFAFHLLAFKFVSMLKVGWYDLPWQAVGGHPYVLSPANNFLWVVLYVLVGITLPLVGYKASRYVAARVSIDQRQVIDAVVVGGKIAGRFIFIALRACYRFGIALMKAARKAFREILEASNPKDE